jgi:gluconate kinase
MDLLLLSGPVAVGKSAVARELIERHRFGSIRTGPYLSDLAKVKGLSASRADLQQLGDALDEETDYRWVVDVAEDMVESAAFDRWLFDCVRKRRQVEHFRSRYGRSVVHVHLTAPKEALQRRYEHRLLAGGEYAGNTPYATALLHPNEIASRALIDIANHVLDLGRMPPPDAADAIVHIFEERVG